MAEKSGCSGKREEGGENGGLIQNNGMRRVD